jgi:hypothetical protein
MKTQVQDRGVAETRVSRRAAAWLAWSVCGLTIGLSACIFVLYSWNRWDIVDVPYFLVAEVTAALVGGLIASRRPRNVVGWLILGHAVCFTLGEFTRQYAIYRLVTEPGSLPLARVMASPPY